MKLTNEAYNKILLIISARLELMKELLGFVPSLENIKPAIEDAIAFSGIDCDEEDKNKLLEEIEYREKITHVLGNIIYDDYEQKKWYFNDKVDDSYFGERYYRYLKEHTSIDDKSINLLHEKTLPDIMNCLYNPKEEFEGKRLKRGLIIGDVQSGKTATYSGLICKAADAGYKVVILLAGITESLRQQTQERIDESVVGYTIRKVEKHIREGKVGVGKDNKQRRATSFTTCVKDFVKGSNLISTTLSEHNSLVLFVVKKNVSVLTKLHDWLKNQNMDVRTNSINHPMLLIDDEADNASVNTKKDNTDPTKTNAIIRKICNLFQTANYIGFTATPFANVFIDPDSVDSMKNADLFPEHFIYTLPTPSSYIGADKIFYEDKEYYRNLRFITDVEEPDYTSDEYRTDLHENIEELNSGTFYSRHKKEWNGVLPNSLKESIYCYYLANVIRDLRGHASKPRSMLVNMSRFIRVQQVIKEHIEEIQNNFIQILKYNFDEDTSKNAHLSLYKELKRLWKKHFDNITDICFIDVIKKKNLLGAVFDIEADVPKMEIIVVNGSSASKLDYKSNPSLRVIAIGGLALSRGLTLEGLLVSYFYRNTATFDVLMQMGRWFGYRPGYADLFQIWTSQASATWYREIATATTELKADIKKMFEQHLTPKDFGIKVRDYCDELQITANNKMRTAYELLMMESYYGNICDTPYLSVKAEHNEENWNQVKCFTAHLFENDYKFGFANVDKYKDEDVCSDIDKSRYFSDVSKELVVDFLSNIKCSLVNMKFNRQNLIDFICDKETEGVDKWDIVFEGGDGQTFYDIPGLEMIRCPKRQIEEHDHVIQISSRRRILGLREGKFCLSQDEIDLAEKRCREVWAREGSEFGGRHIPIKAYFEHLPHRKPVLIIMLIEPVEPENIEANKNALKFIEKLNGNKMIAFAIGFPGLKETGKTKKYKVNKTYYQLNMLDEPDEIEEDEE